jgi:hypothetical protein
MADMTGVAMLQKRGLLKDDYYVSALVSRRLDGTRQALKSMAVFSSCDDPVGSRGFCLHRW